MAGLRSVLRFIGRNGKRAAIAVIGSALILAGVVMMVTPGPGLVAIIAGLAILATEFAWAERALDRAKRTARDVADRARRKDVPGAKPEPNPGSVDADPDRGDTDEL
jgi:uncharacterized protein (TIGR02611 family)